MIQDRKYSFFFCIALALHIFLGVALFWEHSSERPTLTLEAKNEAPPVIKPGLEQEQAIQAVTVDSKEVMAEMNQLKKEREQKAQAEANRQKALAQQAEMARKKRIEEQQRVERLKKEAEQLAITQKKKLEEEKKRMEALAKQQEEQKKALQALEKKQQEVQKQKLLEEQKLAELRTQKAVEAEKEKQIQVEQARAAELEKEKQAQALRAAEEAAKKVRIAGVVDRYKALIIQAIGQQWILPDHVDSQLSSQFRIRLAPNGTVLEVSLIRSSGDPILDRSAQAAIFKASPLPVPSDPDMFNVFRDISLTVRPENVRS